MKETGILFTPENIRLVMDGRKGQTRRIAKWKERPENPGLNFNATSLAVGHYFTGVPSSGFVLRSGGGSCWHDRTYPLHCPYGKVGDRLYIKEGVITHCSIPQLIGYYLDGCRVTEHWMARRTAMFMPKSMARTWLEITEVRVERLQDISEEDAIAEGIEPIHEGAKHLWRNYSTSMNEPGWFPDPRRSYQSLWDSINKKKQPWSKNPWVWVISFLRIK
jgi:hypothetical protein